MQDHAIISTLPQTDIIFDACCLINFDQASILQSILRSLGKRIWVAEYVARVELCRIDFNELILAHDITLVDVETQQEKLDYICYAGEHNLQDGESITGALARSHQWIIATDDKAALACFAVTIPHIALVTTPDIVYHWAQTTHPEYTTLCNILEDIRWKGGYYPGVNHHLHSWWQSVSPWRP